MSRGAIRDQGEVRMSADTGIAVDGSLAARTAELSENLAGLLARIDVACRVTPANTPAGPPAGPATVWTPPENSRRHRNNPGTPSQHNYDGVPGDL